MSIIDVTEENASQIEGELAKDARLILQVELKRHRCSYKELARLLKEKGLGEENHIQLKTKINRGKFSFVFVIRVMRAIGTYDISVKELPRRDPTLVERSNG